MKHAIRRILLLLLSLGATAGMLPAQTTRIMPLGNSITSGVGSTGNHLAYRKALWNLLSPRYAVDFVGTLQGGDGTFDEDHEGHPGWKASEIRLHINEWLPQARPDFVLLHIGTNDVSAGRATQDIINDIDAILTAIWNFNANARIFLCKLIPRRDNFDGATRELNQAIENLVAARSGAALELVDQYTPFVSVSGWQNILMSDDIHPNDTGYQLMAEVFYNALIRHLSPVTPVELVALQAHPAEGHVLLEWTTASERNNLGFFVEHAVANEEFAEIGFVPGAGTTTSPHSYRFRHTPERAGRHRYRLRQMDTDGEISYSAVVEVEIAPPTAIALLPAYPNPVRRNETAKVSVEYTLPQAASVALRVFDLRGRVVTQRRLGEQPAGRHRWQWDGTTTDAKRVAPGMYFIELQSGGQRLIRRVQILR